MTEEIIVPLDVPGQRRHKYLENYLKITRGSGRLMLFAGDQKVEHLNDDFFGSGIDLQDADPEHLFRIAAEAKVGVFATQLGLIARYGMDYPDVPYLVKLNSKTGLVKTSQAEPRSLQWIDPEQVVEFSESSGLHILGVGYTIYLGSEHEAGMFRQAAQLVFEAHRRGLVTVLWMYPRGKAVKDEKDPHLIAGAAGVAASLGSDFVKVSYPEKAGYNSAEILKEAVWAAGRTKVVCAGGESTDARSFLQRLHNQIHISGAAGNATGRNIHQRPLAEAVRLCNSIYAVTVENASVEAAWNIYQGD
ncbi:Fructose-bisphosphate aldolase/6-deoxy-5-ketofructose 1-phosphate synthase [uncultured archaeon]|nr:Fructose-bisphosphate aldolase/6-deoxy-5-ketofructose 1-phosphate synthase [uncultured archaeon]